MNFKRFSTSDNQWHDVPHYIHNTSTDTITTLPADIYANDVTATVGLKGDMVQNGTPTPTTPIQPQECGERTGNLWNKLGFSANAISSSGVHTTTNSYGTTLSTSTGSSVEITQIASGGNTNYQNGFFFIEIDFSQFSIGDAFVISFDYEITNKLTTVNTTVSYIGQSTSGTNVIADWSNSGRAVIKATFDSSMTKPYVEIRLCGNSINVTNVQINRGTTALPYEPYGIKIPILNNSQTTNVYLGEVQSTRRIKKLVLDGTENWNKSSTYIGSFYAYLSGVSPDAMPNQIPFCSHLGHDFETYSYGNCRIDRNSLSLWMFDADTSVAGLKSYLAQQYAAGTPVCVWYVLAEPTTGVVNEPLRKIGDYADIVSGITIPTIAGANTLSVNTTLQPSEVTVNYKGWHPVQSVHVYPDSSWMPTSWEEFRKAVRSGKAQSLYPVGTKLYENWGDTTSDAWIIVDYPTGEDYLDSDLAQQGYTNRVMLMEEKLNYLRQFDAIEAWLYVETAIPAGTYRFTIPNYDASYGGNKTYIFTSTANVPVGGQLTLTWAYQQNPSAVQAYSSSTSTSALFNVSITEWDGTTACTDLGTIKLAQNDADSTYGKLNHIHRARYGSNNYYQSGYRQWLNTNASANWWTPTNIFDRPYGNRTNAGRLNVMNSNMKSVLATPTVNCITNNLFEYPSLDGTTFSLQTAYTVKDKLFPVTHSEINLSSSPNVNSVLDYYVGKGNADRIKYRKDNGNAYYWWLRTPNPTSAGNVRIVSTSGALSNYSAYATIGSAAACIIQ